ncbi:MAG: hypothetical protein ACFFDF_09195 [Candidatus Odinarchaeota archaeon]
MSYYSITHWNIVEGSRYSTAFEGSLQSKMSKLNFDRKILDMLKCKRNSVNIRWFSVVLDKVVRKEVNSIRNHLNRRVDF